jgi:hypothetical protein
VTPKISINAILTAAVLSLLPLPCLAEHPSKLLEARDFRLAKDSRDQVVFSLSEPGTLVVTARIRKPVRNTPVELLLEGPGGLQVTKTGPAPLRLRYTAADPAAAETWHASVINVSKLPDVTGTLTVEIQPLHDQEPATDVTVPAGMADAAATEATTDGKVRFVDDRRIRAVCRDRNPDVSVRLDLERGTGELLMRSNHVFSLAARQVSEHLIEMLGSGPHPLYLDLEQREIVFTSGEEGTFCRVRIYR